VKLPSLPPKVRAAASSNEAAEEAEEAKEKEGAGSWEVEEVEEWEKPFVSPEEKVKEGLSSAEGRAEGKEKEEA
jgi:hypothetical protein